MGIIVNKIKIHQIYKTQKVIKNYQFNAKEHNNNKNEVYEYEVVYLVNTLTPRVGAVLTEEQLSELQTVQKLNYEIKSSKATIVR